MLQGSSKAETALLLAKLQRRLGARMNVELLVNMLEAPLHRRHGNAEPIRNLLVPQAVHDEFEHLFLAVGEALHLRGRRRLAAKLSDYFARDFRGHGHAALVRLPNG